MRPCQQGLWKTMGERDQFMSFVTDAYYEEADALALPNDMNERRTERENVPDDVVSRLGANNATRLLYAVTDALPVALVLY